MIYNNFNCGQLSVYMYMYMRLSTLIRQGENGETGDYILANVNDQHHVTCLISLLSKLCDVFDTSDHITGR